MKPADPHRDYSALVARGYDAVSAAFTRERDPGDVRAVEPLFSRIPDGARMLDLGCGAGVPAARTLAQRYSVVGADVSRRQVEAARANVPRASLLLADMTRLHFARGSFDAVISLYAIFHAPRETHAGLFRRIHMWLVPGGYFLATLADADEPAYTEDFFGAEMYWSNYTLDHYRQLLADTGFTIEFEVALSHGYDDPEARPEHHPLVLARRH